MLAAQAAYQESLGTACAARSSGSRARPRRARARRRRASTRRGRLQDELARPRRARAVGTRSRIDFAGTERRTKRLLVAEGLDPKPRRARGRARPRPRPRARRAPRAPGRERQRQDDAPAPARRRARRTRARVEHAPSLRVVVFDQHRARLDPARVAARARSRPYGDSVVVPGPAGARRRLGEAVPVPHGAARDAGRPALGRRAGARPDRAADARARRPAAARRADERPRHRRRSRCSRRACSSFRARSCW